MTTITSFTNSRVKELIQLKRAVARRKNGIFIIDGLREITAAQKAKINLVELYYCSALIKRWPSGYKFDLNENNIIEVSEAIFQKICYKEKPDGFLAVARNQPLKLEDIKLNGNSIIIVLEAVEKPGNLGAILRTAQAAQVDLVIINNSQTDIYNPNVIRASEGCLFSTQIVFASVDKTKQWLVKNNIKSLAAATQGKQSYTKINLKQSIAIILGSEAKGLSSNWLKIADELIRIPIKPGIDSLNVSVSAAIITFEALRQRGLV